MVDNSLISTQAFVLKKLDYSEDDSIITFFTKDNGKVKAFARHARKSRRRFGSSLDIANCVNAEMAAPKMKSAFHSLNSASLIRGFENIRRNIVSIGMASYMLELYNEMTPENVRHGTLFDILDSFLDALNRGRIKKEILPLYALKFLKNIGLGPNFHECAYCGSAYVGKKCFFKYDRGGIVCLKCGDEKKTGHLLLSPETVNIAASKKLDGDQFIKRISPSAQAARELKTVINNFVEFNLGRKLNSSKFLEEIYG